MADIFVVPLFCPAGATMLTAELARKGLWNEGSSNSKIPLIFQTVEEVVQQTKKMKAKELVVFVE